MSILPSSPAHYEIPIVVRPEDIDEMAHVNNVVYLRWVQEVALAHWLAHAPPAMQQEVGWVAHRHEIDYLRAAVLGDAIVARTWVGAVDSRRFERLTAIVRTSDGALLARARTLWLMINRASGRVSRITPELRALFDQAALPGAP